jgi:hypothetical protein
MSPRSRRQSADLPRAPAARDHSPRLKEDYTDHLTPRKAVHGRASIAVKRVAALARAGGVQLSCPPGPAAGYSAP